MSMCRFTLSGRDVVHVDTHQHGPGPGKEIDSSLFFGFPPRGVPRIDVGGFHMSARLKPPAEAPVINE
jgi:hypothetical protein